MPHLNTFTRRGALGLIASVTSIAVSSPARALDTGQAERFIARVIDDLRALVQGGGDAAQFLTLLEKNAAVPQVGKFAMGRNWREMSGGQQDAYQAAFRGYISRTYAKRFGEYTGQEIAVTGSTDAGRKGVLVKSALKQAGQPDLAIEWLVTDRLGPLRVADIVFEGISLSITLREVFGGMVEKRNGDIDAFIADLNASEGA